MNQRRGRDQRHDYASLQTGAAGTRSIPATPTLKRGKGWEKGVLPVGYGYHVHACRGSTAAGPSPLPRVLLRGRRQSDPVPTS